MHARRTLRCLRWAACGAAALLASACHQGLDTTRRAPPAATLGDDIFGVLCDRLGAGVLAEDTSGASYRDICHYDDGGVYADQVRVELLPAVTGEKASDARRRAIAKIHAMARRRSALVRAINAIFPAIEISDPTTADDEDTVDLHDALFEFAQAITPLYETNPLDAEADPLVPASTRSLGRLFGALGDSDQALGALARIWGRQAYRPSPVGLGAIRAGLAYPKLRELTHASLRVVGPDGPGAADLQQLFGVTKRVLLASRPVAAPLDPYVVDAVAQPNRPRTNVELAAALMLAEHPAFAETDDEPARYIARRDRRGFVVPAGSTPGLPGAVPAPFADTDGDGFADVDGFGRFVDAGGGALSLDAPFAVPTVASGPVDEFGRPVAPLYAYVDTSRTLTGALARTLVKLLDPTEEAPGDPEAWKVERETLMYAMSGAYHLYGGRQAAQYDFGNEAILAPEAACDSPEDAGGCADYLRFRGEDSPLPKLAHAAGQVLADPESDVLLLGLMDLVADHEQAVARLVGAALRVKEVADAHDELARQGQEPFASLSYETPVWDEMAGVLARMAQRPGLLARVITAFADPAVVTPTGGSQHFGDMLATFASMRDTMAYDPQDLNGPALNVTIGGGSKSDPATPVDFAAPRVGDNRSMLERTLQTIHDARQVRACNKQGAKVYSNILGIDLHYPPLLPGYEPCGLFQIDDMATFYLDAMLAVDHPKRSEFVIKPVGLSAILDFLGASNADHLLEESSGITGFTTKPTAQAMNRFVYFGADAEQFPAMPDDDALNQDSRTNKFISSLQEPMATVVCPQAGPASVNTCSSMEDTMRLRDPGTLLLWERLGFHDYLRPLLTVFANECTDASQCELAVGENIFLDLLKILHRHWAGPEHGPHCQKQGTAVEDPRYCSEAGLYEYEPFLADALRTDLVLALHELAKDAMQLQVTVQRGPLAGQTLTGPEVLEKVTRILVDPQYAKSVGMVDRSGGASATWVDGTPQAQLTPFTLFADALHEIDLRFDDACSCAGESGDALDGCRAECAVRGQWRRARSQLIDELFAIDGEGPTARFRNRSTPAVLLTSLSVLREQLNANCPDRELSGHCPWARQELGDKVAELLSGPLFAAAMDLQEKVRLDDGARRETERFLSGVLRAAADGDSLQAMLASASDILQVLTDDDEMSALFNAVATAATPATDDEPGCADTTIKMMKVLTDERYDPYHVLDVILPRLVTPMDDGKSVSPLEVFIDTIAEVNRVDADQVTPLKAEDYREIMGSVKEFFVDDRRGLEQFYYIVQQRPGE